MPTVISIKKWVVTKELKTNDRRFWYQWLPNVEVWWTFDWNILFLNLSDAALRETSSLARPAY